MEGLLAGLVVGLVVLSVVLLVLHELAHVAVARTYGYPVLCLGFSPLAVGIVFLDQPRRRYWILQVVVPMAVTALVAYVGLFVLPLVQVATRPVFGGSAPWEVGFSLMLAVLTGLGDVASMVMEMRRPLWGRDRVIRDVRLLRKIGSLIRFTAFGRRYLAVEFGLSPREFVALVAAPGAARGA